MTQNNPLQKYYRINKQYVSLPSGTSYYNAGVINFTSNGEVGIKPMTSRDELILKNPDALLNGEAIKEVLKSCVDGLVNPSKLLINDIEYLMVAIKNATYGEKMEMTIDCPKCTKSNKFGLDLSVVLSSTSTLDSEYVITLDSGISVFMKPYSYEDFVKTSLNTFEQSKVINRIKDDSIPEEERMKLLTKSFDTISKLNVELIANAIVKLVKEEDNIDFANTLENKKHIVDFLSNVSKNESDKMQDLLTEINSIGLNKKIDVQCQNQECKHTWNTTIDFNPVNFSTGS